MLQSITNYYNLKRCFYKEHPHVEQRSWDEIDRFLNLHQIKFSGFDLPKPIFRLDEINFPMYITEELRMQGILRPTAIQSMTWPTLYSGRDLMCIGLPTHSRVISYICPALVFIKEQSIEVRKSGPLVLIVTQTKEVAKDILTQSQMFMHQAKCSYCCLFDDENINTQIAQLRDHDHDILIGNYHRLCELLDKDMLNLKNVSFLIMDDFYRNRSARLSDEIKRVVNETRTDRQTAIFSRIVPSGLQKSNGDEFQNDAVFVCIGNDDIHVSNKDLPQTIHICTMAEKKKNLITEIAQQEKNFKILVYANGFKKIRITEKIIKELGIDTFAYERTNVGRRRRAMKEKVYYNFNATPNSVLVASDVVSSKVELPDLNYIINADFPVNLSLYLNRMKMSNIKRYVSIFIAEDARHADRLIYVLNECRQQVPQILYKISEAYINSGKDVDRMPSLQEINDGLTKPVEKPIPKPLPPTVCLNAELTRNKKPTEEKPKSDSVILPQPEPPIEPASAPTPPNSNLLSPSENSSSSSSTSSSSITPRPIAAPLEASNPKRVKTFHRQYTPNSNSSSSNPFYQSQKSYSYNQYQQRYNYQYKTNQPNTQYQAPNIQPQQTYTGYYTHPAYYTAQQPVQPIYTTNSYQILNQPQQGAIIYNQGQYVQAANTPIYTNAYQTQYYQSANSTPVVTNTLPVVKTEPSEIDNTNRQNIENGQWAPYFTNPIPFKQEPTEPTSTSESASTSKSDDDSNALTIVTHLLKDKQILNQLEKVAQTFRLN